MWKEQQDAPTVANLASLCARSCRGGGGRERGGGEGTQTLYYRLHQALDCRRNVLHQCQSSDVLETVGHLTISCMHAYAKTYATACKSFFCCWWRWCIFVFISVKSQVCWVREFTTVAQHRQAIKAMRKFEVPKNPVLQVSRLFLEQKSIPNFTASAYIFFDGVCCPVQCEGTLERLCKMVVETPKFPPQAPSLCGDQRHAIAQFHQVTLVSSRIFCAL